MVIPQWLRVDFLRALRFESNSRSATVLGLIGAAASPSLFDALNGFNYARCRVLAIVIGFAVTLSTCSPAMRIDCRSRRA